MINKKTLEDKTDFWKKTLGLQGWHIKILLVDPDVLKAEVEKSDSNKIDDDTMLFGAVVEHYPDEQAASIMFNKHADREFGLQLNLDTLILHELIHVASGEKFDRLPKAARISPRVKELDEWICDFFSRKIYQAYMEDEQ